jgi:hypothetical protein
MKACGAVDTKLHSIIWCVIATVFGHLGERANGRNWVGGRDDLDTMT